MPDVRKNQGACDASLSDETQPGAVARGLGFPIQARVAIVIVGKTPAIDIATVAATAAGKCVERETDDSGQPA